jgi:hypothetical protein
VLFDGRGSDCYRQGTDWNFIHKTRDELPYTEQLPKAAYMLHVSEGLNVSEAESFKPIRVRIEAVA